MPKGLDSEKSRIPSASISILSLSVYGSITSSVLIVRTALLALLADPTNVSPTLNEPEIILSSRVLVVASQEFTCAVVPLSDPVTNSLYSYDPVPIPVGSPTVRVGGRTYFAPPSVSLISVTIPAELIADIPLAV